MRLSQLLEGIAVQARRGDGDPEIASVTADSRSVGPGVLWAAIRGRERDGHAFLPAVATAGAAAAFVQDFRDDIAGPVLLQVEDPRRALAEAASALLGQPSRHMLTFGVTGTNGKTSTATIAADLFAAAGLRAGVLGTAGNRWTAADGRIVEEEATHTTPEGPALHGLLARMRDDGVEAVALELSSHALHQGRAAGLALDVAAWTNLTRDHLDYHGTMEAYEDSKAKLFGEVLARWGKPGAASVLWVDDAVVARHAPMASHLVTVSCRPGGAEVAPTHEPRYSAGGVEAEIATPWGLIRLRSRLLGAHNLANLLLAGTAALSAGIGADAVERGWASTRGAPGRLEPVEAPREAPKVLVDYAHTPDALLRVLAALRPLVSGRLIVVFGCGGDRDAGKRAEMGRIAGDHADRVYLTSDNPRSEDAEAILDAIAAGLPETVAVFRDADRRHTIHRAVAEAHADDIVLIAGKGHETYQEIAGRKHPFDDRVVAREALGKRRP